MIKTKHQNKTRRIVRGFVNRLTVYDGAAMAGSLLPTDDGHVQVYDAEGYPAGCFDTFQEATRSLPKAEPVS